MALYERTATKRDLLWDDEGKSRCMMNKRGEEKAFSMLSKNISIHPLKCDAQFLAEAVIIASSKIYRSPDRQKDSFM